jgi:hypothetical protein
MAADRHIALVIDNVHVQEMRVDDRMAAILLSDPLIIDVTGSDGNPTARFGDEYNPSTGTFTTPPPVKPYPSWVWNEETERYEAPSTNPSTEEVSYFWDEDSVSWVMGAFEPLTPPSE